MKTVTDKTTMTSFPDKIVFRYPWRSYQQRVLDELDGHLKDRHLHLVAPPGSGKTVLGLEVMLRVNQPTIIIAPTLTIKEQWADRFTELFLQTDQPPDWVSTNLKKPAFVTITTYQSLHSLYKEEKEERSDTDEVAEIIDEKIKNRTEADHVMKAIQDIGFKTIVLDEAHHLRTAWWKSTLEFRSGLQKPTVVALTATPPYDVNPSEWQRYLELCGPIDAEISVAELVREAELCPHQDYLYLSLPTPEEEGPLITYRANVREIVTEIRVHDTIALMVETHPWIVDPEGHTEDILSNPAYYSSMIIYLKTLSNPKWENALKVIGADEKDLPPFSAEWVQELLTGLLYKDDLVDHDHPDLKALRKKLTRMGAVERRKVQLMSTTQFDRSLVHSVSKLTSVQKIVEFERDNLQDDLRMVILTDYIRKDDLPRNAEDLKPLTRLGVIPIFELIRRNINKSLTLGVLTGSLVILPVSSLPAIEKAAVNAGVEFSFRPMPHDENFVLVDVKDSNRSSIVSVITEVFSQGEINVLVGTAALLGEGWDAPSINALIMASYVGSFMLSNQMRGRAIRTEKGRPDKSAAIWHLACVDVEQENGGHDLSSLRRRFKSLVGLSIHDDVIETGIARMGIHGSWYSREEIEIKNIQTLARAQNRHKLIDRWMKAVSVHGDMTEELTGPASRLPKPITFYHTVKALMIIGGFMILGVMAEAFRVPSFILSDIPFLIKILLAGGVGVIFASPLLYRGMKLSIKHKSIESSLKEVAYVVYDTLHHMELLEPEPSEHRLKVQEGQFGSYTIWMLGGTTHEKTIFLKALQEVLDPIENPRYLIYREAPGRFGKKEDYHAVPEEIGRKKAHAEFFYGEWEKKVGRATLIYTRSQEGRKQLLSARMKAMSTSFVDKSERISAWR